MGQLILDINQRIVDLEGQDKQFRVNAHTQDAHHDDQRPGTEPSEDRAQTVTADPAYHPSHHRSQSEQHADGYTDPEKYLDNQWGYHPTKIEKILSIHLSLLFV